MKTCPTILVIDDDASIRETASAALTHFGFTVLTATNGEEGVETYRRHADRVVAVILDLCMPVMDGERAFAALRAIRGDVPVIIASACIPDALRKDAAADAHTYCLPKPYGLQRLLARVNEATGATCALDHRPGERMAAAPAGVLTEPDTRAA